MPHICVSESGQHWFRYWLATYFAPSHYLNECWVIVNWTPRNKPRWNFIQNKKLYIHENVSKSITCEIMAICPARDEFTLKHNWVYFFKVILFLRFSTTIVIFLVRNWSNTTDIISALWLLMAWCFSTRAAVATQLITHPGLSSHLWVKQQTGEVVEFSHQWSNTGLLSIIWHWRV